MIVCVRHAAKVVSVGNLHHDLIKNVHRGLPFPNAIRESCLATWSLPSQSERRRLVAGKGFHLHHFVVLAQLRLHTFKQVECFAICEVEKTTLFDSKSKV